MPGPAGHDVYTQIRRFKPKNALAGPLDGLILPGAVCNPMAKRKISKRLATLLNIESVKAGPAAGRGIWGIFECVLGARRSGYWTRGF